MDFANLVKLVENEAKGFEYELFLLRRKNLKISTENGEFDKISTAEDFGLGVRLLKDQKMGFAYTSDLSEDSLRNLVNQLKEITQYLPPDEGNRFKETFEESKVVSPYDGEAVAKPVEEKIETVISFEREVLKSDPRVVGTRETTFTETVFEVHLKNSYGVEFGYEGTAYSIVTSALAESSKGDRNIVWSYRASRLLKELNLQDLKEELLFKLLQTLDPEPFESQVINVVFTPETFALLLETFSELFLGEKALKGKTPLVGKEGEKVASEILTLVDDGTLPNGFSTHPYDDEGTPQQRSVLIEKGTFKGFLHSLYSAAKLGKKPTGNGYRSSFTTPPACGISNFFVEPVEGSLEEFIRTEGKVFLVTDLMGLHTADTVSGDFSLGASGVIFETGQKKQAVRGVTVAGNFLKLLNQIEKIGSDLKFYGNVGSPSLLVKNITVGGI